MTTAIQNTIHAVDEGISAAKAHARENCDRRLKSALYTERHT